MFRTMDAPQLGLTPRRTWLLRNHKARADAKLDEAILEIKDRAWPLTLVDALVDGPPGLAAKVDAVVTAAVAAEVEVLAVAGGDGTLHAVAGALRRAEAFDIALAPIPCGTGNDLCRSLGRLELPAVRQLESAMLDASVAIDVIEAIGTSPEHQLLLNAATFGSATRATSDADRSDKARLGWFAYVLQGLKHADVTPWPLRVWIDDELHFDGGAVFLSVTNGRTTGGGWVVSPGAMLDDGELDVRIVGSEHSIAVAVLDQIWRRLTGPDSLLAPTPDVIHEPDPRHGGLFSRVHRGRSVRFEMPTDIGCNLDGEQPAHGPRRFELRSRALRIVPGPVGACLLEATPATPPL